MGSRWGAVAAALIFSLFLCVVTLAGSCQAEVVLFDDTAFLDLQNPFATVPVFVGGRFFVHARSQDGTGGGSSQQLKPERDRMTLFSNLEQPMEESDNVGIEVGLDFTPPGQWDRPRLVVSIAWEEFGDKQKNKSRDHKSVSTRQYFLPLDVPLDQWIFAAFTVHDDALSPPPKSRLTIYVNDNNYTLQQAFSQDPGDDLRVGAAIGERAFLVGFADDIVVFDSRLNQTLTRELQTHLAAGTFNHTAAPWSALNLARLWRFDDDEGKDVNGFDLDFEGGARVVPGASLEYWDEMSSNDSPESASLPSGAATGAVIAAAAGIGGMTIVLAGAFVVLWRRKAGGGESSSAALGRAAGLSPAQGDSASSESSDSTEVEGSETISSSSTTGAVEVVTI